MNGVRPSTRIRFAPILLITVTLSACMNLQRSRTARDSHAPQIGTTQTPSTTQGRESVNAPLANAGGRGSFVITVIDQNNKPAEGIQVKIAGPHESNLTSDGKGEIRIDGPAGFYTFQVLTGCFEKIRVISGGSGRFGLAAGQTGRGQTRAEWHHRIGPSPPVFSDLIPYWPPGEMVTVRYNVADRCSDDLRKAPGASFPSWVFEIGPTLMLAENPLLRASDQGYGYVKVVCLTEGSAKLEMVDSKNPADRLDLIENNISGADTPSCRHAGP